MSVLFSAGKCEGFGLAFLEKEEEQETVMVCVCVCVCERERDRVSSHTHAGWHGHTTGKWQRNILKTLLPSSSQSGKEKNDKEEKTETDRGTLVVCRLMNVCNLNRQVDRCTLCV